MYKNNIVFDVEETITIDDIKYIEDKYNYKMPEDIKNHYLKYNGGQLEKCMYTKSNGDEFIVSWFIPIKCEDAGLSLDSVLDLRTDKILPAWLIPFADEAGGDLYCYSLREKELGAIYYWSHETMRSIYITKSLEDFLNNMEEFSY